MCSTILHPYDKHTVKQMPPHQAAFVDQVKSAPTTRFQVAFIAPIPVMSSPKRLCMELRLANDRFRLFLAWLLKLVIVFVPLFVGMFLKMGYSLVKKYVSSGCDKHRTPIMTHSLHSSDRNACTGEQHLLLYLFIAIINDHDATVFSQKHKTSSKVYVIVLYLSDCFIHPRTNILEKTFCFSHFVIWPSENQDVVDQRKARRRR